MAATEFLHANRLTEEKWPSTFFEYTLENMVLSKFIGSDSSSIIQTDKNLQKAAGDMITMRLRIPLSNAGGYDDSDLEGNEESLNFHNFQVQVHERGNAVRSAGKMTDQRTKINIQREAFQALGDWAAEQLDNDLVYALSGIGNQGTYAGEGTSDISTVNEKAPSTNRIIYGGQTAAGVVTLETSDSALGDGGASDYANYYFGTKMISIAKRKATLSSPKMRPIPIRGKKYFVMLLHPYQVKALRLETGDHGWQVIQSRAGVRGLNNPLFQRMFDDAIGIYDDVILYEYDRIQTRVGGEVFDSGDTIDSSYIVDGTSMVCRALFLGAQAGCLAWAQMPKKYEKDFDYNRKPGTAIDMLYGVSKTQFADPGADQDTNTAQDDYAVICVDTCAADD